MVDIRIITLGKKRNKFYVIKAQGLAQEMQLFMRSSFLPFKKKNCICKMYVKCFLESVCPL